MTSTPLPLATAAPPAKARRGLQASLLPLAAALLLAALPAFLSSYGADLVLRIMVYAIFALSLELLVGVTGLVSLGHAAFLGIGAYVSVLLDTGREITVGGTAMTLPNLPFLLAIAIAGLTCMVLSVLIGRASCRERV